MASIHMLRCKAEPLPQSELFTEPLDPQTVLTKSFLSRPTTRVPRGAVWHIGNTSELADGAIFFALGREAIVKSQQFDDSLREFQEIDQIHAPFTIGVFDPNTQVAGVLIRQGVSMNASEVANKLQILLESVGEAARAGRRVVVDFIPDPTGFLSSIEAAYKVTRFEFEFAPPNPPDDEKYIQRPLKNFAERAGASEGKASIRGTELNKDVLIDLTRSLAATGDNVTANLQMEPGGETQRKSLQVDSLRETVVSEPHESSGAAILRSLRQAYLKLRGVAQ